MPFASSQSRLFTRILIIFTVLCTAGYLKFRKSHYDTRERKVETMPTNQNNSDMAGWDYLPTVHDGKVYFKKRFALSYAEKYECPEWVAYILTKESLNLPKAKRLESFESDPSIATGSASDADYRRSGFDRGHQVPSADMSFDTEAMSQTYLFSNICPQDHVFNKGVWRELEEQSRDWARKFRKLYIVNGAIWTSHPEAIGSDHVAVPSAFYRVLLDNEEPEKKAIAFVIQNQISIKPLRSYMISVDSLENLTGIHFFNDLPDQTSIRELKAKCNPALWYVQPERYEKRIKSWNKDDHNN